MAVGMKGRKSMLGTMTICIIHISYSFWRASYELEITNSFMKTIKWMLFTVRGFMKYFTSPENTDFALHDPRADCIWSRQKISFASKVVVKSFRGREVAAFLL